ncbi:MAG TPA: heavy metal translocating P-type ATPase, partial [Planctomycetaceae bacterium]|nr:heavy metal translocating P-type ATPase [Planctomycetaceae bacterium]
MNRNRTDPAPQKIVFRTSGEPTLHCVACEERVAKVLRQIDGVHDVHASSERQRIAVEFDPERAPPESIHSALKRMGYTLEVIDGHVPGEGQRGPVPPSRGTVVARSVDMEGVPGELAGKTLRQGDPPLRRGESGAPKERHFALPPRNHRQAERPLSPAEGPDDQAAREKLQVKIGGMECSFCVGTITKALLQMHGVERVSVNKAHEEALVHYDPARVTPTELKETLREIGYAVRDIGKERSFEEQEAELRAERNNLLYAAGLGAIALNFMVLMWFDLLAMDRAWPLMIWLAPTLALATMFGPGWRFLLIAWASLKRGILNQHVLMEFGAWAGLVGGFLAYVVDFPESPLSRLLGVDCPVLFDFFGVVVFINTYHILSAYVSLVVRTRASQAVRKLLGLVPPTARVVRDGREIDVPIDEVERGELVRVRPGEAIPLDGVVVEGVSGVDEHLVTGESIPQEKTVGDEVIGGSLVQAGTLLVRVTKVGAEGFLQQVARQVEEARALKPGVLILVDQVLKVYVPAVLGFAVAAFLIWTLGAALLGGSPDWTRALLATLAVLVMGYPCALGMATPLAMIRGGGMAAQRGILMRSGEAFQVLKDVRKVILDKTGTITRGEPAVAEAAAFEPFEVDELIRLAASAENASEHPLGRAIVSAAERLELAIPPAEDFRAVPGQGVEATGEGRRLLVGKPAFLEQQGVDLGPARDRLAQMQEAGYTVVALAVDGQLAGLLAIADQIKPDAEEAVRRMRQLGLEPVMLTGDNPLTARAVAQR